MEEEQKGELETTKEAVQETVQEKDKDKISGGSVFEGIYDKLPDISIKSVDRFICICVIAFVVVVLVGVLKANHIF